jgi:hypothetical protein
VSAFILSVWLVSAMGTGRRDGLTGESCFLSQDAQRSLRIVFLPIWQWAICIAGVIGTFIASWSVRKES